ncbi:hypothetical protein EMCRGX_G021244 [Ephydatia muelleri]|eukprot:Em0531g11a
MAAQSEGIRKLMAAEKLAATMVADARKKKAIRLKEAKEEAAKEIEAYKSQRESAFQEQLKKFGDSKDDFAQKMEEDKKKKLVKIDADVKQHKAQVIQQVLELVYNIQPQLHQNARFDVK